LIHFETRASKPRVFRITSELIEAAKRRRDTQVETSLGNSWDDISPLARATALVTAVDLLIDPKFPRYDLTQVAPHLRWIHVTGAGIEPLLPLDWLPPTLALTNNSGVHVDKVQESAMMMLLMLNARLPALMQHQREARWDQIFSPMIRGRTALVIGVGDMGGTVASAARRLGLRVLGVRRSGAAHPDVDRMGTPDDIDHFLPEADFVVCAAPLTPGTANLIDRRRFALMKPGSAFINIGRAGSVDYAALIQVLDAGALSGAILDVYDLEPLPPTSSLWTAKNLILMPHVSSDDEDEYLPKTLDLVFENSGRLARGEPLLNVVDPERGY
jgi:phosphoglycerate dehydrogenase-like enzyme